MILVVFAIHAIFQVLFWAIIVRALMTWLRPAGYNRTYYRIERVLDYITEPILGPIRRLLPVRGLGFDWSPLVAIVLLSLLERLIMAVIL